MSRKRITIERTYQATLQEVWDLWTTKEGFESWWGPEGFTTQVVRLDLRPGGELLYEMTATAPEQVAFLKQAGMPLSHPGRITFTEIVPLQRLAYTHRVDFVPGTEPYDIATVVELRKDGPVVRMVLTFDAMHTEEWTQRAVMGWESQLVKLSRVFTGSL